MIERRKQPFQMDEAKFSTQKIVTFALLLIFATVVESIFLYSTDPSERSTVLQTVINFTMLAVGFWLGSSKGAVDNREQLNKMLDPKPGTTTVTTTESPKEQP
jgi:hypothetical protein